MKSAQSCPTLCDPVDCSLPGSSVHGILQARVLDWVAISFSRDWIQVSHIAGRCFIVWATREAQMKSWKVTKKKSDRTIEINKNILRAKTLLKYKLQTVKHDRQNVTIVISRALLIKEKSCWYFKRKIKMWILYLKKLVPQAKKKKSYLS